MTGSHRMVADFLLSELISPSPTLNPLSVQFKLARNASIESGEDTVFPSGMTWIARESRNGILEKKDPQCLLASKSRFCGAAF